MDALPKKTFKTSRNFTYTYYDHKPSTSGSKPTLLLLHGWPDDHTLFSDVLPILQNLPNRIVIPDLLGYGGTSKPSDYEAYNLRDMTNDLYELLSAEDIPSIISIGHDWGCALAQRMVLYQPERCSGLVMLNVAYMPPFRTPTDLIDMRSKSIEAFGYPAWAYWDLYAADDGPEILGQHIETLFHLLHWDHPDGMRTFFCTEGNTRKLLQTTSPDDYPLKPHAKKPGFKEAFVERMQRDGFEGPQAWYKALARDANLEYEKTLPEEAATIRVPVLFVGATGDAVCRPEMIEPVKVFLPDLTTKIVEAGHWDTYEKPEEVGGFIREWVEARF